MTLLDRALHKAYARRSSPSAAPSDVAPAAVRGWVAKLRTPQNAAPYPLPVFDAVEPRPADSPASEPQPVPVTDRPADDPLVAAENGSDSILPVAERFAPAGWSWPSICDRLLESSAGPGLHDLAALVRTMPAWRNERVLALTGFGREAGRTALTLLLARLVTEGSALRVLLVDLDLERPQLAKELRVATGASLWRTLRNGAPPATELVTLIPDRLAILPGGEPAGVGTPDSREIAALHAGLRALREEFDLLLIDGGPWDSAGPILAAADSAVETCIGVIRSSAGPERGAPDRAAALSEALRGGGLDCLGVIETFAPAAESQLPLRQAS